MDRKKFAVIKYDHGERMSLGVARRVWLAVLGVLAVGLLFVFFPLSLVLGLVALVLVIAPPSRQLCLGPRYLICGTKILYYANIQRLALEAERGRLVLESSTGQFLVLEQDRFQTNARKPDKIAANKAARFKKVAQKLVRHVRHASPDAELTGVGKLPATGG
ncbi:MAG TPA: hypothetical protein VLQ93_06710 [Myxococcaceae bacterium]|nr:hypothetical protein [Myxococcaceae bacterium]